MHMWNVDVAHCCSFDAREWSVVHDDFEFAIVSPTRDAELRITAYDCGHTVTMDELVEIAKSCAGRGTEIAETNCGQFAGIMFRASRDDLPYHAWYVTLAESLLTIELTCNSIGIDEYLKETSQILASLRDARP